MNEQILAELKRQWLANVEGDDSEAYKVVVAVLILAAQVRALEETVRPVTA